MNIRKRMWIYRVLGMLFFGLGLVMVLLYLPLSVILIITLGNLGSPQLISIGIVTSLFAFPAGVVCFYLAHCAERELESSWACIRCGYDLRGHSPGSNCPECGRPS